MTADPATDPNYRPATPTPCTPDEVVPALALAWVEVYDEPADPEGVQLLAAQSALETGWWRPQSCRAYNLAGHKRTADWGGLWTAFDTQEVLEPKRAAELIAKGHAELRPARPSDKGTRVLLRAPGPGTHFVAFESLEEGAFYVVRRMRDRYASDPEAAAALRAGDAKTFVRKLKERMYFTEAESKYLSVLEGCLPRVRKVEVDWSGLPTMSSARAKRIAESGALSLWGSVRQSQQWTLADLERARREREGGENV
jgi:hypothetical protein